jgi:hypothetical protein
MCTHTHTHTHIRAHLWLCSTRNCSFGELGVAGLQKHTWRGKACFPVPGPELHTDCVGCKIWQHTRTATRTYITTDALRYAQPRNGRGQQMELWESSDLHVVYVKFKLSLDCVDGNPNWSNGLSLTHSVTGHTYIHNPSAKKSTSAWHTHRRAHTHTHLLVVKHDADTATDVHLCVWNMASTALHAWTRIGGAGGCCKL